MLYVSQKHFVFYLCYCSKVHGLVACGGDDGAVECFDMRARHSVGRLDALASTDDIDQVTALLYYMDYHYERKMICLKGVNCSYTCILWTARARVKTFINAL